MVAKFDPVDVDPRRRSGGSDATPNPTPDQTDPLKTYGDPIPVVFGSQWVNGICASAGTFNGSGRAQRRDKLGYSFTDNWLGIVGTAEEVTTVGQGQYLFCAGPVVAIDAFSVNDSDPFLVFSSANGGSMHYSYLCAINSGALFPPTLNYGDFTATVPSWRNSGTAANRVPFGPWVSAKSDRFLGPDQRPPKLKAFVRGYQATLGGAGTIYTTNAVTAIKAIVEHKLLGLGLPSGTIVSNVGPDNASGSSLDTFLAAVGWGIRRTYSRTTALEAIDEILRGIDSTCVWTGSALKLLPLYDQAVGSYAPSSSAQALGDDDFIVSGPDEEPIEATRTAEADTYNVYPIQFPSSAAYVESPTVVESMAAVKASAPEIGVRRSDTIDLPTVSSYDQALYLSGALASRASFNRTKFRFRLSWRYIFLEPGDLVTLTQSVMGLSAKVARIQAVEESDDGIVVEAIEWYPGTSVTPVYSAQTADGQNNNPLINRTPPVLGSNPINLLPGTIGGANLLANGSFDVGATTGGGTDGWVVYDNNGVATLALRTDGGMFGANYARVAWTSNPNTTQPKGLLGANNYASDRLPWGGGVRYGWKASTTYTVSYYARSNVAGTASVEFDSGTAPASVTALTPTTVANTSTWARYAWRIVVDSTPQIQGRLYVGVASTSATGQVDYDGLQVTEGLTLDNFAISPYDGMQASAGALYQINDFTLDNRLSPPEKPVVVREYRSFIYDRDDASGLAAKAAAQGVSSSAFTSAVNTLASTMSGYGLPYTDLSNDTAVTAWSITTTDINGATLRSAFDGCYLQRGLLQAAVSAAIYDGKTAKGPGSNLLYNGDFSATGNLPILGGGLAVSSSSLPGWAVGSDGGTTPLAGVNHSNTYTVGGSTSLATSSPAGNTTFWGYVGIFQSGQSNNVYFYQDAPVVAGKRYMASVYSGVLRGKSAVRIDWYDSTATPWIGLGSTTADANSGNDVEAAGGNTLSTFKRIFAVGTAPTNVDHDSNPSTPARNATVARVVYSISCPANTYQVSQQDTYGFFAKALVEESDSATPGPWSPGQGTFTHGTSLSADAIKTSNYAESSGYPTSGAKMDITGSALKVAFGGLLTGAIHAFDTGIASGGANSITDAKRVGMTVTYPTSTYSATYTFTSAAPDSYYTVVLDSDLYLFTGGVYQKVNPQDYTVAVTRNSKTTSGFSIEAWLNSGASCFNFNNTGNYRWRITVSVFSLW